MTDVVIPLVLDGNGDVVPATVSVALVNVDDLPVVGFVGTDLATEYQELSLKQADLTIPLAPQSSIGLQDGGESYYRVTIATAHRREKYLIQVPDDALPQDLADLVGAEAQDSATVGASRLLPSGGELPLTERSTDPADPSEGSAVIWQSDGTETGDDGDVLIKVTAGGVTKTTTLVDFSEL